MAKTERDPLRRLDWDEHLAMVAQFPRGVLVRKTIEYPLKWTMREVNKGVEGFVHSYGRTDFRPLHVQRVGTVAPIESELSWWEVVAAPAPRRTRKDGRA